MCFETESGFPKNEALFPYLVIDSATSRQTHVRAFLLQSQVGFPDAFVFEQVGTIAFQCDATIF